MIAEIIFSLYIGIAQNKYTKDMCNLVQKLNSENVNVIQYINDSRFKIFDVNKFRKKEKKIDLTDPKQHRYMTEQSIRESIEFIEKNKKWLELAEEIHGVDKEYITAILNIESHFGGNKGEHPVLNALFSNYIFTERKDLFYEYIKEFIKFAEEGKLDVFEIKGSYTGASGTMQFMPDNLRKYAIDLNGNGFDLYDNVDGIGSCAEFLEKKGFKKTKERLCMRTTQATILLMQ
jgi:membrane-bound lytic murein transglycosylase B